MGDLAAKYPFEGLVATLHSQRAVPGCAVVVTGTYAFKPAWLELLARVARSRRTWPYAPTVSCDQGLPGHYVKAMPYDLYAEQACDGCGVQPALWPGALG
jgi:hypothetical protein